LGLRKQRQPPGFVRFSKSLDPAQQVALAYHADDRSIVTKDRYRADVIVHHKFGNLLYRRVGRG